MCDGHDEGRNWRRAVVVHVFGDAFVVAHPVGAAAVGGLAQGHAVLAGGHLVVPVLVRPLQGVYLAAERKPGAVAAEGEVH
ncbi:MAG: hypothetical protein DRQ48_00290 [Gammaproteobacteria bacterium]|nr:MAG: hypothetical protein DRQ48_00290 [Gammaproteobacteria bacterium]